MYDDRVNAPTGGPNSRPRRPTCNTPHKRLGALVGAGCAALSYLLGLPLAAAEQELRVTGSVTIEASASQLPGASDVQARLLDDAGHAVVGARLLIRPLNASLPVSAHECHSRTVPLLGSSGAYAAQSNGAGSVCVHFEGTAERAEFELSFSDASGLYGSATRRVIADSATRSVEMAFAPAPSVLALERDTQVLSLLTRPQPPLASGAAVERLDVVLNVRRAGQPSRQVAVASVEIGSSVELKVPSNVLGPPGAIELGADFAGSPTTRAAHTIAHATATALASLSLAESVAASHPESGVHVRVRVTSVAGSVPSGSVEARLSGVSLGSARVTEGLADLYLQVQESAAQARPLELRYVPDAPWWLPGSALQVTIPILPPSPWRRIAWIAAVAVLGSWLLLGWQRPRRIERAAASLARRQSARAPVDIVEVGDATSGWHGQVIDAHDGAPIPNAVVLVRLPAFDASGILRTAHSDALGAFVLTGTESAGPGAALEVRAPFHSPLAAPMPPPGTLILSLTSRRRTLLGRFVEWAVRDGGWERRGEATPGEVARRSERSEVATWAGAVDEAAYGPEPLSEAKEQAVVSREPPHNRKLPAKADPG